MCVPQAVSSPDLEATFSLLSRTSYSWEDLQQRPLPHGVDPARIEAYLDTLAFQVNSAHCGGGIFVKSKMEADRDEERSWALLTPQPITATIFLSVPETSTASR